MAERRMFAKTIIQSDAFRDMGLGSQALYLQICLECDDDGFCNKPKAIARCIGASEDDLKLLILKKFLIAFEDGIVVVKHWRINNQIRNDRYKATIYQEHLARLEVKDNNGYTLVDKLDTKWIPSGYQMDTQYSIGKYSIDKYSDDKEIEINNYGKIHFENLSEMENIIDSSLTEEEKKLLSETYTDYPRLIKTIAFKIVKYKVKKISNIYAYIVAVAEQEQLVKCT